MLRVTDSDEEELSGLPQRLDAQLKALDVSYVDACLLYSPGGDPDVVRPAWRQLEAQQSAGRAQSLGLRAAGLPLLAAVWAAARVKPVVVQNKFSVYQPGGEHEAREYSSLMEWMYSHGVAMIGHGATSPADGAAYLEPQQDPHAMAVAARVGRSASQVLHRWLLQLGAAALVSVEEPASDHRNSRDSVAKSLLMENTRLFDFDLEESDVRLLNGLAALAAATPGRRAPVWCEDVYGLVHLPE